MTADLTQKKCQPCEGKGKPFSRERAEENLRQLPFWQLSDDAQSIRRDFVMKNFMAAIRLIEKIADLAEKEGHHPEVHLTGYRNLRVELTTHAIGGLSQNDFIEASKINELPAELKK